jgi:hypothetical protein
MDKPKTVSVPEAGREYFNLSRNGSYEAARCQSAFKNLTPHRRANCTPINSQGSIDEPQRGQITGFSMGNENR